MSLWIKICANTSLEDALLAADAGANAVGFVFASSPRRVTPAEVAAIVPHLPATLEKIGVFVDASFEEIEETVRVSGLTGVQLHFDAPPDLPAKLRAHFGPALRILRVIHFDADQDTEELRTVSGHDRGTHPAGESRAEKTAKTARAFEATEKLHSAENLRGFVSGHDFSRAAKPIKSTWALAPAGCLSDSNIDAILIDSRTAAAVGGTGQSFDWSLASKALFQNEDVRKPLVAAGGLTPANVAQAIATLHPWGVDVVSGVESTPGRKDPAKVRAFIANSRATHRR